MLPFELSAATNNVDAQTGGYERAKTSLARITVTEPLATDKAGRAVATCTPTGPPDADHRALVGEAGLVRRIDNRAAPQVCESTAPPSTYMSWNELRVEKALAEDRQPREIVNAVLVRRVPRGIGHGRAANGAKIVPNGTIRARWILAWRPRYKWRSTATPGRRRKLPDCRSRRSPGRGTRCPNPRCRRCRTCRRSACRSSRNYPHWRRCPEPKARDRDSGWTWLWPTYQRLAFPP